MGFKRTQKIEVVMDLCVAAMKKTDILKDVPEDTMHTVIKKATAKFEPKDSVLFKQGDQADGCYIILRGKIAIHAKSEAEVREERRRAAPRAETLRIKPVRMEESEIDDDAEKEAEWEREKREQAGEQPPENKRTTEEIKEEMRKDEESA